MDTPHNPMVVASIMEFEEVADPDALTRGRKRRRDVRALSMATPTLLAPVVGQWYQRSDRPQPFQVVAVDASDETIEIEYFDGTIDEWPLSHWHNLDIEPSGAPPDATGALDEDVEA
jgi:hypothetical protein